MKDYSGIRTLRALIRSCWEELDNRVKISDIIDNLKTASDKIPLSANMGKVLYDKIRAIDSNEDGKVNNSDLLDGHPASYFAKDGDASMLVTTMLGNPNGICPLDETRQIPSEFLPSYVDDVIEVYVDIDNHKMYRDPARTTPVTPEKGKIYIALNPELDGYSYRWGGSKLMEISSPDMVEISEEATINLWNSVKNQCHNTLTDIKFIRNGIASQLQCVATSDNDHAVVQFTLLTSIGEVLGTVLSSSIGAVTGQNVTVGAGLATGVESRVTKIQAAIINSSTNTPLSEYYEVDAS